MNSKSYETAFRLIISDFREILMFIEPVDENLKTYSHRIYELFLRSCTEFESICKDTIKESKKILKKPSSKIKGYRKLYDPATFYKVQLHYWHPANGVIQPFRDWDSMNKLSWYGSYDEVKHNRNKRFDQANFGNLIFSIAGLFTMLHLNHCLFGRMAQDVSYEEQAVITHYYDYLHSHVRKAEISNASH